MNNSSTDDSAIMTSTDDIGIAPLVVAVGAIVVSYIVIANSVLIVCFMINRPLIWNGFTRQIFNLAISDALVGLAGLPRIIDSANDFAMPYTTCAGSFYLYFSAQNGTLFHVLAICVQRTIMLRNIGHPVIKGNSTTRNNIILISAWLLSLLVGLVPFLLWSNQDQYRNVCVVHILFGHNYKQAMTVLFLLYLIPLVVTDLLYTCAVINLYCKLSRVVVPAPQESDESHANTANTRSSSSGDTSHVSMRHQRKVFGTIGILLLLLNVFTIPLIIIILFEQMRIPMDMNTRWSVSILFMCNSAVNPVVYAIRIKTLNNNLKQMFRSCWSMIR